MVADILDNTQFNPAQRHVPVAVLVEQLPSHTGLKKYIGTGDFQGVFYSVIVPVRRYSILVADLIGYLETGKRHHGVHVDAGLLFKQPAAIRIFRISLLIPDKKREPGQGRLILQTGSELNIVPVGHIFIGLGKHIGYRPKFLIDRVVEIQIRAQGTVGLCIKVWSRETYKQQAWNNFSCERQDLPEQFTGVKSDAAIPFG